MQVQLRQWLAVGGNGPAGGRGVIGAGGPATSEIALYQQKGNTFAIWQFNDRVPPPSTRLSR